VRGRVAVVVLATALSGCVSRPAAEAPGGPSEFSIRHLPASASPSPWVQVQSGSVQALVPDTWEAAPLPQDRYPQQGFVASPSLADWDHAVGKVRGMEAFWIDLGKEGIPSDYYYLAARVSILSSLATNKACTQQSRQVFLDRPPDLTGRRFSPSDYVASGSGVCRFSSGATRWAYVVAAPGYGPIRQVGIPNSGLYVVIAVVSVSQPGTVLKKMIDGPRFGNTSISQIVSVASRIRS